MKQYLKIIILICLIFFSHNVLAASLEIKTEKDGLELGGNFSVSIILNTEGQSINTIEGDLKYDASMLKGEIVDIGDSFVSFWVEKPDFKNPGLIHFSGIVPGGISSNNAEVFKIIFTAYKIGNTSLTLNNMSLFLNDGEGSIIKGEVKNASMEIIKKEGTEDNSFVLPSDENPPEKFNLVRSQSTSIFDDKNFIVFSTLDKGSGVAYYKVCEFFKCTEAKSPFLLSNQTPFYYIRVSAYDVNGNITTSSLLSPYLFIIFLLLLSPFLYISYRYLYKHKV